MRNTMIVPPLPRDGVAGGGDAALSGGRKHPVVGGQSEGCSATQSLL